MLLTQALKKLLKDKEALDTAMLALQRLNLRGTRAARQGLRILYGLVSAVVADANAKIEAVSHGGVGDIGDGNGFG